MCSNGKYFTNVKTENGSVKQFAYYEDAVTYAKNLGVECTVVKQQGDCGECAECDN